MQVRGVAWHGLMPHAAPPVSFKIYSLEVTTINSDKHCFGGSHNTIVDGEELRL